MTIDDVWNDIMLAQKIFRSLIVTSNTEKKEEVIGWPNYTPGIYRNLYAKEYEILMKKKQYTYLLKDDKGFLQIFFRFTNDNLSKVKLAYYPYPVGLSEKTDDIEIYMDDSDDRIIEEYYYDLWNLFSHHFAISIPDDRLQELINESKTRGSDDTTEVIIHKKIESKYSHTNSSHVRIDFDPEVATHNKCEIQVGAINNIRFPAQKVIMPFLFFDFIAKNIFPDEYKQIRAKSNFVSGFSVSKKLSLEIKPFREDNIYFLHQ